MHNSLDACVSRLILTALLILFLQSCSGTVDFTKPLHDSPALRMIDPLPLKLSPKIVNLVEISEVSRFRHEVLVGNAFKSCFRYTYLPTGQLDLIDSKMSTTKADNFSLESNYICNYTITVSLKTAQKKKIITAHGKGTSGLKPSDAAQYAVENAVLDLYKKIESILK